MSTRDTQQVENSAADKRGTTDSNYEVGYQRPPKHSQFKPGQSGNPRGRPKRPLSFAAELADGLYQVVADGDRKLTHKQAIANTVMAAARNNAKLVMALIDFCEKYGRHETDLSAADDDAFVERLAAGEAPTENIVSDSTPNKTEETENDG